MPTLQKPNSDVTRLALLAIAIETGTSDIAKGENFISQALLDELKAFYGTYLAAYQQLSDALGERVREVEEADRGAAKVEMYLRHLWDTIGNRAERQGLSAEVLRHYQLPISGERPRFGKRDEILRMAELVVAGDAAAVADGYAPAQEPSAAELQAVLMQARTEARQVREAEGGYIEAQEAVEGLRARGDELTSEVLDAVGYATRKEDAPRQRRQLRRYGATYRYLANEPRDPDDPEPLAGSEGAPALP